MRFNCKLWKMFMAYLKMIVIKFLLRENELPAKMLLYIIHEHLFGFGCLGFIYTFFVMKGSAYIFSNFKVRLKFDVIFGIWLSCTRHGSQNNECNNGAQNVLMKMDIFAMPLTQIIGSTPDSTKNQTSKPLLLDYSGNTICVFSQTENKRHEKRCR